ncbi:MAG TPA: PEP-CTERM sorting domain-containing protein, partial [Methyloversatilis sp.]
LQSGQFEKVIGLGAKDFSLPGNRIDPLNNGNKTGTSGYDLISPNVKGLYMPDGLATYEKGGQTYILMANEGDFREDDGDRSAASTLGATGTLANLRVSNTDSSPGDLYAAGGRSFSIRAEDGTIIYDSGEILDREAMALGIYNDARSRDKGVEPESVEVISIGGKSFAFVGLERTAYSNDDATVSNRVAAIAVFDITDPANSSFVRMLKTDGDMAPEGLKGYALDGMYYLAYSNEVSNTTSVFQLAPVPEPETYAMMLAGIGLISLAARRRAAK